jgi:hypothetical protein
VIVSPRKSVTRFFIPLIDVLILLFCIFLLMPFVSNPVAPENPDTKTSPPEKELPTDVKRLQEMLTEEKLRVARLEQEKLAKITDRLSVRVLDIDPTNGVLFYYDPERVEIKTDADAERLILKQLSAAGRSGKDVYFLIRYPRGSGFPLEEQIKQMERWFKNRPHGFENPGKPQ